MKTLSKQLLLLSLASIAMALAVAGCGSSSDVATSHPDAAIIDNANDTAGATASSAAPGSTLTTKLAEYSIEPSATVVKAGNVKVTAVNDGSMMHEVVFLKTDTPQGKLKVTKGRVSESDSVGEVADIEAGKTKKGTIDLKPGKYVLVCNIDGHYQLGMHSAIVAK
jgi:uncharacterized cupredoxin-like copper-binding protein